MKYNGISFDSEFWKGKTEAEFIAHEKHHGLSEAELKEAFVLINTKSKEEVKVKTHSSNAYNEVFVTKSTPKKAKPAETTGDKKA